jgi:uncharacterized protein
MSNMSPLWEIRNKGSQITHYIFGTMHLASFEAFTHVELARKYIDKVSHYSPEMDLAEVGSFTSNFVLPTDQYIETQINKHKLDRYRLILRKAFDIEFNDIRHFSPFYLQFLLAEKISNNVHDSPLDFHLYQYALSQNKVISGVESYEDQIEILRKIPYEYSLKNLDDILSNTAKFKQKHLQLCQRYVEGDIKSVYNQAYRQLGSLRQLMLHDRNQKMATTIASKLEQNTTFVAIGAAHLWGKNGVIAILKRVGYRLAPIFI